MLKKIFYFYKDGFSSMTLGKSLWTIIIIKLIIMFAIIKPFFPNILNKNHSTELEKARAVSKKLLSKGKINGSITK